MGKLGYRKTEKLEGAVSLTHTQLCYFFPINYALKNKKNTEDIKEWEKRDTIKI